MVSSTAAVIASPGFATSCDRSKRTCVAERLFNAPNPKSPAPPNCCARTMPTLVTNEASKVSQTTRLWAFSNCILVRCRNAHFVRWKFRGVTAGPASFVNQATRSDSSRPHRGLIDALQFRTAPAFAGTKQSVWLLQIFTCCDEFIGRGGVELEHFVMAGNDQVRA